MDRETLELGENEREVKAEEFTHWMNLDTTSEFRRRLLNLFDPHVALLSVELGQSADRLVQTSSAGLRSADTVPCLKSRLRWA